MTSAELQKTLDELQRRGVLPRGISPAQMGAVRRSILRYSEYISQDGITKVMDKLLDGLKDVMNPHQELGVTKGGTEGSLRGNLSNLINQYSTVEGIGQAINLDFIIHTAASVMGGSGRYIADTTPQQVALYPGWALSRLAERDLPRGFRKGKGGVLVPVPDDDWPARWQESGESCGDDLWVPWSGDSQTGEGVALKESAIWITLGNLRDDSLGNPFPPFAFNSGFGLTPKSRAECIDLGLIDPNDEVKPPEFNLEKLINIPDLAKAA
jgi:hypothetical protein